MKKILLFFLLIASPAMAQWNSHSDIDSTVFNSVTTTFLDSDYIYAQSITSLLYKGGAVSGVDLAPGATAGQTIKWDGENWVPGDDVSLPATLSQLVFFPDDSPAAPYGGYNLLAVAPDGSTEEEDSAAVTLATSPKLIDSYGSFDVLPVTTIPGGEWFFDIWAKSSSASGTNTITVNIYSRLRDSPYTETLLFSITTSALSTSYTSIEARSVQPEFTVAANSYLVAKYYGNTTSAVSRNISFTHNGTTRYSFFRTPITSLIQGTTEIINFSAANLPHIAIPDGGLSISRQSETFMYNDGTEVISAPLYADFLVNLVSPTKLRSNETLLIPLLTVPSYSYPNGITVTGVTVKSDNSIAYYEANDTYAAVQNVLTLTTKAYNSSTDLWGDSTYFGVITPSKNRVKTGTISTNGVIPAGDMLFLEAPAMSIPMTDNWLLIDIKAKGRTTQ